MHTTHPGTVEDNLGMIELGLHEGKKLTLSYEGDRLVMEVADDLVPESAREAVHRELNAALNQQAACIEAFEDADPWYAGFIHGLTRASSILARRE